MSYTLTTEKVNKIFGREDLLQEEAVVMHKALLRQGNTQHGTEMSTVYNQAVKNDDTMSILKKKVLTLRSK